MQTLIFISRKTDHSFVLLILCPLDFKDFKMALVKGFTTFKGERDASESLEEFGSWSRDKILRKKKIKALHFSVQTVLSIVKFILNQSLNFALGMLRVDSRHVRVYNCHNMEDKVRGLTIESGHGRKAKRTVMLSLTKEAEILKSELLSFSTLSI